MTSTNNNNLVTPNNLFALENEVMNDLTNFNKTYQLYLTCNKNQSMFGNVDCTSDNAPSLASVITVYNKLTDTTTDQKGSLVRLQTAIDSLKSTDGNTNDVGTTQAQYIANYNYIMNNYKNVVKKRQSLDSSLAELYEILNIFTFYFF